MELQDLANIDVDALPEEEVRALLKEVEALAHAEKYGRFYTMFPDAGPFRRELYPRHLEFFRVGKDYTERLFRAANRCLSPWTYLQTAAGSRLSAEVWTSANPDVLTWDGGALRTAQAQAGLLKGIEPMFRLVTGSGRFSDCSRRHRVLTSEGWLSLDQLMSRASGLRCWHTAQDYQASCDRDGYLGDRPLRRVAGIDLAPPPSQGGAQRPALLFELPDEAAHTLQRIRACPGHGRLTTRDDLRRFAALFGLFSGPSSDTPVLRLSDRCRDVQRFAAASALAQSFPPSREAPADRDRDGSLSLDAPCMLEGQFDRARGGLLLSGFAGPHSLGGISLHDGQRTAIFYPSSHPLLIGGEKIVAVVPLGFQPIIDAHVPGTSNYAAGGLIHHNTGKSEAGCFETTAHLTGEYPHWWEGWRPNRPINAWVAGETNETTRDILQKKLLGEIAFNGQRKGVDGSGMIPAKFIVQESITWKAGVPDLIDTLKIRHKLGGFSDLGFKAYAQGRGSMQGTEKDWVHLDEEPPMDVYNEMLIRLMTTGGRSILTFTPLSGATEVVESFEEDSAR